MFCSESWRGIPKGEGKGGDMSKVKTQRNAAKQRGFGGACGQDEGLNRLV